MPIVVVGTKIDIREENNPQHVSHSDGQKLMKQLGAVNYVECSAKTMTQINDVFDVAIRYDNTTT